MMTEFYEELLDFFNLAFLRISPCAIQSLVVQEKAKFINCVSYAIFKLCSGARSSRPAGRTWNTSVGQPDLCGGSYETSSSGSHQSEY